MLQATRVLKALEDYAKAIPEVPLEYKEDYRGIIVLAPHNFDLIPPMLRAAAYAEIEVMMATLTILQTNPRIMRGSHFA